MTRRVFPDTAIERKPPKVDWNAPTEEDLKPPLHPEGAHLATVVGALADTTSTGKIMLRLIFKTAAGKVHGRLVYSPESDTARRMWFKQLANMQVGKAYLDDNPSVEDVAIACLKAQVLLKVIHREFEGNTFADVNYIDEAPGDAAA